MANSITNRLGTSTGFNYTPKGEKHLPPSSIEGKIPCILTGKGVDRPTTIYVRPGRVRFQIKKYKDLQQALTPPADYDLAIEDLLNANRPVAVPMPESEPVPRPPRKVRSKPVICLNTGKFFESTSHVAKHYKLSTQIVNFHLSGKGKQAKGHLLRFATLAEIMEADKDINWTYKGELFPMVTGKRNF